MIAIYKNILTRNLPKTGQAISYTTGDDGQYENGWWRGRLNINNRVRFRIMTIGSDDVVVDRATGLMWARDGSDYGCYDGITTNWVSAINFCNTLYFAGYSDWRLPNLFELFSIINIEGVAPYIADVFQNTAANWYWTSSTVALDTALAWAVRFTVGQNGGVSKANNYYLRAVRSISI
jgi:hypothetical protein